MNHKPFLLLVEGPDGVGKTTFCNKLIRVLVDGHGLNAILVREPVDRACLTADDPIAAFAADRAKLYRDVVLPAISADQVVISDRSFYSSLAYQGRGDPEKLAAVLQANMDTGLMAAQAQLFKNGLRAVVVLLPSASFRAAPDDAIAADAQLQEDVRAAYIDMLGGSGPTFETEQGLGSVRIKDAIVLDDGDAEDGWRIGVASAAAFVLAQVQPGR